MSEPEDTSRAVQDTLLTVAPAAPRRGPAPPASHQIAAHLPVARLALDLAPPHLDRPFDYLVPATMSDDARPGVRVKVRFAGRDVDGYVLERVDRSDHDGRLLPLRRVVSAEPVLAPAVARLARAVADHYAGTLSDVLRLAVPPRHARAEQSFAARTAPGPVPAPGTPPTGDAPVATSEGAVAAEAAPAGPPVDEPVLAPAEPVPASAPAAAARAPHQESVWAPYRAGAAFLAHVAGGGAPRAVWTALPGLAPPAPEAASEGRRGAGRSRKEPDALPVTHWAAAVAEAVRAARSGGRGALVVVPDARDVDQVCAALAAAGLPAWDAATGGEVVRLTADEGPAPRYRAFLAVLHGDARVVVGTRAAAFAPVVDLGLVVCWNDGEDTLAEPRAPYPHAREVLALRSDQEGAAFLLGSHGRTVAAHALVVRGWAHELAAPRDVVRARAPRVRALTSVELAAEGPGAAARIPTAAWRTARAALEQGPVLVQVPRSGYVPVVACGRCRTPARCTVCHGPLALSGPQATPQCAWCGALAGGWSCAECHWTGLRSVRVGSQRTAEELGRAFAGVPVQVSGAAAAGGVLGAVSARPALVVATPGAEPVAEGGYAAALLLDAAVSTAHVGLDVAQDALARWLAAAALVRPATAGGQVLLVGDAAPAPTNALVRWDPALLADRELDERVELSLPPAVRVAAVTGDRPAVAAVLGRVALAGPETVLGPVEVAASPRGRGADGADGAAPGLVDAPPVRAVVRVPVRDGRRLARELGASVAVRSARREPGSVRVELDPKEIL
ncbi:primosomal protein N' [Cellulosimicrobium funkei]|uniref:Probable replication restart protein PriA n=1 Tax=Cellulosimicrobium funkei TaxID=264251 RepID=A0A4Y8R682_9MICO|nr:primosomal protein N' [Cellulosimicrobium funkei]TFF16714.1 primosomal protein N' [Cellulosimicrobium funkei]TGA78456.1 primosomal protein N' [Cellulosimicrobium terreum]